MHPFTYGEVSAVFTNTVRDELAVKRFLILFGISQMPSLDDEELTHFTRSFCVLAGHTKKPVGLVDEVTGKAWTPPGVYFSDEDIRANAELFFACLPFKSDLMVALVNELNAFLFPGSLASKELQGTGTKEDFLAPPGSELSSASSTPLPENGASLSRSQKKRQRNRTRTRSAGQSPTGTPGS